MWKMCSTLWPGRMEYHGVILHGVSGKCTWRNEYDPWVLDSGMQRICGQLHPNWDRGSGSLWRGLSCQVIVTEVQLLLAPWLPALGWMFKGKVPSTHHATDAMRSKSVMLATQQAPIGKPSCPVILEFIMKAKFWSIIIVTGGKGDTYWGSSTM